MSWNARKDLLERGFRQCDVNDSERFELGDMVAYLDYDAFPPYSVVVRINCKVGDKVHTLDVLSAHWLDTALEMLDERVRAAMRRQAR
jgi:hypothetical protein